MYYPKSKYKVKQASAGKFIYETSGRDFEGGSYMEFSDGTMYRGTQTHLINANDKIVPKIKEKKDNTYILGNESNVATFKYFTGKGPKISKQQDKLEPIFPSKPAPTSEDYIKGFFHRYFAKRKNSATQYYEINKETYSDLKDKGGRYDYNLYHVEKIKWDLSDSAKKSNRSTLRKLIRTNPLATLRKAGKGAYKHLNSLFPDLEEYKLSNDILRPKISPENINRPKPKLPLQKRKSVVEAQKGAIDLIKEKSRRKYNKSSGGMGNMSSPTSTPSSGGGGGY